MDDRISTLSGKLDWNATALEVATVDAIVGGLDAGRAGRSRRRRRFAELRSLLARGLDADRSEQLGVLPERFPDHRDDAGPDDAWAGQQPCGRVGKYVTLLGQATSRCSVPM
jgi:hypothetical protein